MCDSLGDTGVTSLERWSFLTQHCDLHKCWLTKKGLSPRLIVKVILIHLNGWSLGNWSCGTIDQWFVTHMGAKVKTECLIFRHRPITCHPTGRHHRDIEQEVTRSHLPAIWSIDYAEMQPLRRWIGLVEIENVGGRPWLSPWLTYLFHISTFSRSLVQFLDHPSYCSNVHSTVNTISSLHIPSILCRKIPSINA